MVFNIDNNKKSLFSNKSSYVTPDHKTSHKGQFFLIDIYTINTNLESEGAKNVTKIVFQVVQMKFLAMHITNPNLSFDIFTNVQNIFMDHDLYLIS